MAKEKPSIPKGTRDFLPEEMTGRKFIFNSIEEVFRLYGYLPIETPSMENLSTLTGKYGEEGDRLLFKILNSGDYLGKVPDEILAEKKEAKITSLICGKGLRYDLTVPFARFVVQYRDKITFPFKRYQIQAVWRADRPQKGRYREFYQCDVDVIGSNALINESELVQIIDDVFKKLNIKVQVKLNNRKVLAGIAEKIGESERFIDLTIGIDKLEKIGIDAVMQDLLNRGLSSNAITMLRPVLDFQGSNTEKLIFLEDFLQGSETGLEGVTELIKLFGYLDVFDLAVELDLDICLARGLNYYTGTIIEVKSKDFEIGSICGGGRYDDLTGIFGMEGVSGVGISFGADRIYDVLKSLSLFPDDNPYNTKLMFVNFGSDEEMYCLACIAELRSIGINSELYPDPSKMKKQMNYANSRNIPYVVLVGAEEMKEDLLTLKCMETGDQKKVSLEELKNILS